MLYTTTLEQNSLSEVSHDINNYLAIINSQLKLLEFDFPSLKSNPNWTHICHDVMDLIVMLRNLTSDRETDNNFNIPINLNIFLLKFYQSWKAEFALHHARLDLDFEPNSSYLIYANPSQLTRLLNNLLTNAIDALPQENGHVTLSMEQTEETILIKVSDNGSGIPTNTINQIFKPKLTTKEKGNGLGLAISKKIVEEYQGKLSVASVVGKGSTFVIEFPAA